ncbi:NADPH:quinone reductase [Saccharopolyspora antimicrobica]|uniref:NADPH:quinone reductase n=1 Tax=Saccharopolyspora antimicrobica TaxID=455193 RepID=A0A1I5K199_9PSEU|nr:zinc-binding dehydrogenase [Saccharopolyspora antimicrobica]RKT84745.1 NADPH:quinone reductase-like Zn-dependent oxidoreductase [Saccharopolyspora antimicrobica]SFO78844.1 NADPH:quinone reductase [Saccharopolyspora antimicrobica]
MRALVVDPAAPAGLRISEVPEPEPGPGEVLLDVGHISLNHGEIAFATRREPGTVHGYDAAGVVVRAAAGSPPAGARVIAFGAGAWAERMVVGADAVAEVPDSVDLADAAALPMAGLTALRTLRTAPILGKRVLITGASGGVGRYAVQLAAMGGAHVVAQANRQEGLAELGAHEVVSELSGVAPVDLVLDNVGGRLLVDAWGLVKLGGSVQNIGWASGEPAVFEPYSLFAVGRSKSLNTFGDVSAPAEDLSTLAGLLGSGRLSPEIGYRGSWEDVEAAAKALLRRDVRGKAVLELT